MNNTVIQDKSGINSFYAQVYSFVGIGLGISAVVAALLLYVFQGVIVTVLTDSLWIYYTAVVAEFLLVIFASGQALRNSPAALPLFIAYSALNGFTLSLIMALYAQSAVLSSFVTASVMFFVMAVFGKATKKDLSGVGRAGIAALWGLIIAAFANIFLQSSMMEFIISLIGVIVFSGLIAWDNQRIRNVYESANGNVSTGWAISLALSLYLDFINLFLSLLRLFGRSNN